MIYDANPPYDFLETFGQTPCAVRDWHDQKVIANEATAAMCFWISFFFVFLRGSALMQGGLTLKVFYHVSIEKVNPPFQGVNGKTD